MKSQAVPALSILLALLAGAVAPAAQAAPISVKAWASELKSALDDGDLKDAGQMLKLDSTVEQAVAREEGEERRALAQARKLYAAGKYSAAMAQYDRIPKGHDNWLEAVEEKGWSALQNGDAEAALAQTKTLLAPQFSSVVGSEPYLLQSLAQLKICDYSGSLETHGQFRKSQRERLKALQDLADAGTNDAAELMLKRADRFPLTLKEVGSSAGLLPRQFYRDLNLQKALLKMKLAGEALNLLREQTEEKTAAFARKNIPALEKQVAASRADARARLKVLADREATENFNIVQKLNLIEIDVIHRVHTDQQAGLITAGGDFNKVGEDDLVFPDDGNPWIDELDKFQVRVNACPKNVRRKM